jgi:hypothetical protein
MSHPSTTVLFHELVDLVEKIKRWLYLVGLTGIASCILLSSLAVCVWSEIMWGSSACGPGPDPLSFTIVFQILPVFLALISAVSGLKILGFVSRWRESYDLLSKTGDEPQACS